jgi:hypothetical protein
MRDDRRPFRDAQADIESARHAPDTPQARSPAYRLAFADPDFLAKDELRPVRLQLELLKPELELDARGITSTIVSVRRRPRAASRRSGRSERLRDLSPYYEEARKFARAMTERSVRRTAPKTSSSPAAGRA